MRTPRLSKPLTLLATTIAAGLWSGAALGDQSTIDTDADYARLIDAIRAAEYVRSDYILDTTPEPRVFGVLAAASALVDLNPDATDAQVTRFMEIYDGALASFEPSDPGLIKGENFLAAVRFAEVSDPMLLGLETSVGQATLDLLGMNVPAALNFDGLKGRNTLFEIESGRSLRQSPLMYDILVSAFCQTEAIEGQTPAMAWVFADYLANIPDLDPALGAVRMDRPSVNSGMLELPATRAAYLAALDSGGENILLQQLETERTELFGKIGDWTQRVETAEANAPTLIDSLGGSVDVAAIEQQLLTNLNSTTPSRVITSGSAFLLLQSPGVDPDGVFNARDFAAVTLETNDSLAYLETGLAVAGGLTDAGLALAGGNPFSAAGALLPVVSDLLGLGLTPSPTTDELILELSQQVADMQVQLNDRFDRVDAQLRTMYDTIVDGFTTVSGQITAVQSQLAMVRTDLRRIESVLFDGFAALFDMDLRASANNLLNYRAVNGELPYAGPTNSFVSGTQEFFNYATLTAQEAVYAGSGSEAPLTITFDNADDILGGGAPLTRWLNDLRATRRAILGDTSFPPEPLAGIEPWSQGASAYTRMANTSPWYAAYRQTQANTEVADLMTEGQRTIDFIEELRQTDTNGESALFNDLFARYTNVLDQIDAEINILRAELAPASIKSNGSLILNPWGSRNQNVEAHLPTLNTINIEELLLLNLSVPVVENKGYRALVPSGSAGNAALRRIQLWHFLEMEAGRTDIQLRGRIAGAFSPADAGVVDIWLGTPGNSVGANVRRLFEYRGFVQFLGAIVPFDTDIDAALWFLNAWTVRNADGGTAGCLVDRFAEGNDSMPLASFISCSPLEEGIYIIENFNVNNLPPLDTAIDNRFLNLRQRTGNAIVNQLCADLSGNSCNPTPTPLELLARELEQIEALIDAYVTLAAPDAMDESEALRSALRGLEGKSELGLRSGDLRQVLRDIVDADFAGMTSVSGSLRAPTEVMRDRVAIVKSEIEMALARPMVVPPYLRWVMAELKNLDANALKLAADDTYTTQGGVMTVAAENGVLANDTQQLVVPANMAQDQEAEFLDLFIDPLFDPSDAGYMLPANGTLSLQSDGGFTYTPDAGFEGEDMFTYRAATTIVDGSTDRDVRSMPATVVVRVTAANCPADVNGDGTASPADFTAWLGCFNDPMSASFCGNADVNRDGSITPADFTAWLGAFNTGCD